MNFPGMKLLPRSGAKVSRAAFGIAVLGASLLAWPPLRAQTTAPTQITSTIPTTIPAGAPGITLTLSGYFPGPPAAVCFYTGYGSTTPLAATSAGPAGYAYNITVPASTIQQVPPTAFVSGTFTAVIYATPTPTTPCINTGNPAYSNNASVAIVMPVLTATDLPSIPARNPNLIGVPPPRELYLSGTSFSSSAVVTIQGTTTPVNAVVTYISPTSLKVDIPANLPPNDNVLSFSECNHTPSFDYCATKRTVAVDSLNFNAGTLSATPNPAPLGTPVSLRAVFGDATQTGGFPTGTVTFSEGSTTLGTAPLLPVSENFVANPSQNFSSNGATSFQPIIADFNQDGLPDVFIVDGSTTGTFHLLFGADNFGGLTPETQVLLGAYNYCNFLSSVAVADFNNDGYPDIAVLCTAGGGADTVYILLNNGDGSFFNAPAISIVGPGAGNLMAAGDFNKDGKIDLVIAGQLKPGAAGNGFTVLFGDGTGHFPTNKQTADASATGLQMSAVDLNNDGYPDLVILGGGGFSAPLPTPISVFQNDGTAGFGASPVYTHTFGDLYSTTQFFTAPVKGSKYPNLIAISAGSQPGISVVLNNQTPTIGFSNTVSTVAVPKAQTAALGDFNGDGNSDIAIFDGTNIQVFLSSALGQYTTPTASFTTAASRIQLAGAPDVNGDGFSDLLILSPSVPSAVSAYAQYFATTGTSSASLPGITLASGPHTLAASSPGTITLIPASAQTTLTVAAPTITVSLGVSPLSPTTYSASAPETFTATVATSAAPAPTGNVRFFDNGTTLLGVGTLSVTSTTGSTASISAGPLAAGTHTISALYTGDATYGPTSAANITYVVQQASPVISWTPNPATIPYGTPLSSAQLNASASANGVPVPGVFTYNPAAGTVLTAGGQRLTVSFTPTDTINYTTASAFTTITVTQATPVINWPAPAAISEGTPLSPTQLNATATGIGGANLPGVFTYNPGAGTVLPPGTSTLNVSFVPTDATDYKNATATNTITVNPAPSTTSISSSGNPSQYGQLVTFTVNVFSSYSPAVVSGTATVFDGTTSLGTVTLANGTGTVSTASLAGGPHTITATYNGNTNVATSTSAPLTQTVNPATTLITWPVPASITYGTPLSASQLNATASTAYANSVAGTFTYTPAAGTVLTAGTQTLSVTFTPTDTASFKAATGTVNLTVTRAKPTLTWPAPAAIAAGTPLSATQLNATATGVGGTALPGTFTYTPPAGTVLPAGTQTLSVTFAPTDATDYASASTTVPITVVALTLTSLSSTTASLGDPAKTITLTGTGFFSGSVVMADGTAVSTTFVNSTTLTAVIPAASFTTVHTIQVLVNNPAQSFSSNALTIAVTAPPVAVVLSGPPTVTAGAQPNLTFSLTNPYPVPLTGTFTLTFAPASGLPDDPTIVFANGTRTLTFTIPANSTVTPVVQLQSGSVAGTITVGLGLTAGGVNVTPAGLQPVVIAAPVAAPGITTISVGRSGTTVTVVLRGYSNTREMVRANFHFTAVSGEKINTPDLTIDATPLFGPWYSSATSQQYGSTFTYTQTFNVDQGSAVVGSVSVTLANTIGTSPPGSAQ